MSSIQKSKRKFANFASSVNINVIMCHIVSLCVGGRVKKVARIPTQILVLKVAKSAIMKDSTIQWLSDWKSHSRKMNPIFMDVENIGKPGNECQKRDKFVTLHRSWSSRPIYFES